MPRNIPADQERLLRMVEEIEDYAIILLDRDGNIENWNRGAEKIKGYTPAEIIGKNFRTFYTPEDKERHVPEQLLLQATELGKAHSEGWRLRKDGTRFWGSIVLTAIHDSNNNVTGFTKVTRDLTLAKQQEESLRKSEERYHKMVQEVTDYAIILLDIDGNIVNWNRGAEKIKGYTPAEIIGKNFRTFYTDKDRENKLPERLITEARENGRALHEGWRVRKNGSTFWGLITITALHDDLGNVIGFSKVTRDLTDKIIAEKKQQQYVAELERKNKELEQFAYITSHDLQEPLRTISSFADLLKTTTEGYHDEHLKMYTSVILKAAERMRNLIKGLLDYSRIGTGIVKTKVDCNQLLEDVESDMHTLITETGTLLHYKELPVITGYHTELYQLFQNLIGNAIKYHKKDVAPEISVTAERKENEWLFSVADNGIGMNPKYIHKIFLIFQRLHTRDEYPGSGIGLANCKKIVELHGGEIWVRSELNEGSTFYFTIPINTNEKI